METRMKSLIAWLAVAATPLAQAHEGHGLPGPHGHATDAVGYLMLALIVAAALWAARRK
jgi:hypothetical protein